MMRAKLLAVGVICLVSISMSGCGAIREKAQEQKLKNDLKVFAMAYHGYHDLHRQGPENWDELIKENADAAEAIQRVRDAGYEVKWGVKFPDLIKEGGMTNTVMAEKPGGGPKAMFDGSVQ